MCNVFPTMGNSVRLANKYNFHNDSRRLVVKVGNWWYGCDQMGRELSGLTGVTQVSFQVLPKGSNRQAISYLEGEIVPKNRGIMTDRIQTSMFDLRTLQSKVGMCRN